MTWYRDDGNPKAEGHEGSVACYVRDALTSEWRELGGKWVPHKYAGQIRGFEDRKVWERHKIYLDWDLHGDHAAKLADDRNPQYDADQDETVEDVGASCECGWRSPRIQFNPSLKFRDCGLWGLDDAGYEDVRKRLYELWNEHMDGCCGKTWTDADYSAYQKKLEDDRINKEVRAELEREATKRAKFDAWGRFQKKEHRIPRKVTDEDVRQARQKDRWRWF